jgi:hypothetical protein
MEAEELKKTEDKAETCDAWGHVIRKPEFPDVEERPMISCECSLLGHPCPDWLWLNPHRLLTTWGDGLVNSTLAFTLSIFASCSLSFLFTATSAASSSWTF